MERTACEAYADEVVELARERYPRKTVDSLTISAADGDYTLRFEDGLLIGADVN